MVRQSPTGPDEVAGVAVRVVIQVVLVLWFGLPELAYRSDLGDELLDWPHTESAGEAGSGVNGLPCMPEPRTSSNRRGIESQRGSGIGDAVSQAALFALVTSGALIAGAFTGMRWMPPVHLLASLLAFAAGALTAALAFELFEESFTKGGHVLSGIGFAAGAGVFVVIDVLLDRRRATTGGSGVGVVLLAGVTLDGVPENLALGTTLAASGGSLALLAAIVVSNFPEALVGARSMCENGRSVRFALGTWSIAAVVLAAAIIVGYSSLRGVDERALSVILAFAGGAVLASVANTLFPKAYKDGGPWVTLATVAGFLVAFTLGAIG